MSYRLLPIADLDAFEYDIAFSGTRYFTFVRWNVNDEAWYIRFNEFATPDNHVLSLRLVYGVNLFRRTQYIIPGTLVCVEGGASNHNAPVRSDFRKDNPEALEIRYYETFYPTIAQIPDLP